MADENNGKSKHREFRLFTLNTFNAIQRLAQYLYKLWFWCVCIPQILLIPLLSTFEISAMMYVTEGRDSSNCDRLSDYDDRNWRKIPVTDNDARNWHFIGMAQWNVVRTPFMKNSAAAVMLVVGGD
jgi:hypothetical protein